MVKFRDALAEMRDSIAEAVTSPVRYCYRVVTITEKTSSAGIPETGDTVLVYCYSLVFYYLTSGGNRGKFNQIHRIFLIWLA